MDRAKKEELEEEIRAKVIEELEESEEIFVLGVIIGFAVGTILRLI